MWVRAMYRVPGVCLPRTHTRGLSVCGNRHPTCDFLCCGEVHQWWSPHTVAEKVLIFFRKVS